ncbi:MAG: HIRAN domain-containing protein [Deltaproteobacteria bacterium]|nr:HIRAN domain-containing protein [Deltaproteobacteria bacterium]
MNWIQHIIEPNYLALTWLPPSEKERRRLVVGQLRPENNKEVSLVYLVESSDYQEAIKKGFKGYPGLTTQKEIHKNVLDLFLKRVPSRSRRDFKKYLESIRIPTDKTISDLALLGYSGARLPDDTFDIIHPFEEAKGPCELLTKITGFDYYEGKHCLQKLTLNTPVTLKREPHNPKDPDAVSVFFDSKQLGYINRVQSPVFSQWLEKGQISQSVIEKKNGSEEHPRFYLFISVTTN